MTESAVLCERCGRGTTDGGRCPCCPQCGGPKSATALRCYACAWPGRVPRATTLQADIDPTLPVALTKRRQVTFRIYCFACGRASEMDVVPPRIDRCEACGGTMLVEMGDNG
jgi:hypothetical protein